MTTLGTVYQTSDGRLMIDKLRCEQIERGIQTCKTRGHDLDADGRCWRCLVKP